MNSNVVRLDATTLEILQLRSRLVADPVQSVFGPAGSRYGTRATHLDETFVLALERETGGRPAGSR